MKVLKTVSIKLESNKQVTISHVLYFFWQLLYETKLGLRIDRIMSNHYVYAHEFALGFKRNYWTQEMTLSMCIYWGWKRCWMGHTNQ